MIHAYPRARRLARRVADAALVIVVVAIVVARVEGPLARALLVAIPCVLVWGALTLHHPSSVEIDDQAITFRGYGRAHRFAWRDVREIRVRRFLTGDRVLVRVLPAPPLRGRYWIQESIEGYAALLRVLEEHEVTGAGPPG